MKNAVLVLLVLGSLALVCVAWLTALFIRAALLSREARQAAGRLLQGDEASCDSLERRYRSVIALLAKAYPLVIPVISGCLILSSFFGVYALWHTQMKILRVVVMGLAVLSTFSLISIFSKHSTEALSLRLVEADHPRLFAVVHEIISKAGVANIPQVFLTSGEELILFEQGSLGEIIRNESTPQLRLGAGLLGGITPDDLRPILAKALYPLSEREWSSGSLAHAIDYYLLVKLYKAQSSNNGNPLEPALGIAILYHKLFTITCAGAKMLQNVRTSRFVSDLTGPGEFHSALRRLFETYWCIGAFLNRTLDQNIASSEEPLPCLFPLSVPSEWNQADIAKVGYPRHKNQEMKTPRSLMEQAIPELLRHVQMELNTHLPLHAQIQWDKPCLGDDHPRTIDDSSLSLLRNAHSLVGRLSLDIYQSFTPGRRFRKNYQIRLAALQKSLEE
ncbi:hypothetical protein KKF84_09920 [Myxococcota bacterium]|nr:hypothetical protein [Myxococcota bacterium]